MPTLQGKKCFECGKPAQCWRLHKSPVQAWCYRCRFLSLEKSRPKKDKIDRLKKPPAFVGMDTETDKGKAVLICTSERKDGAGDTLLFPRSFAQIVHFLKHHNYLCWNSDYDCQAIFKFLPRWALRQLATFSRVDYLYFHIRFVPHKFCTVSIGGHVQFKIYDLCQFYAKKLQTAALELGFAGKKELPAGLITNMRAGLESRHKELIIDYCKRDAQIVKEIGDLTAARFHSIGISFARPVSCASLSAQRFKLALRHNIPRECNASFRYAYRGGRFECLKLGYFKKAYLYDINSAYPGVMSEMPAWFDTTPEPMPLCWPIRSVADFESIVNSVSYACVKVRLNVPPDCPVPIVPYFRTEINTVCYPAGRFITYLDKLSYLACKTQGWIEKTYPKGWVCYPAAAPPPFAEMKQMYIERKAQPEHSYALKILMNSSYGKLAQTLTKYKKTRQITTETAWLNQQAYKPREQWVKSTNFLAASHITAAVRLQLWEVGQFDKIIFYATDGIASTEPLKLETSKDMGKWGYKGAVRDLVVVGSGVYGYTDEQGQNQTHFRGFNVGIDLKKMLDTPRVNIPLTMLRNTSLRETLRSDDAWKSMNILAERERFLNIRFDLKRFWLNPRRKARELLKKSFDSQPWIAYDAP